MEENSEDKKKVDQKKNYVKPEASVIEIEPVLTKNDGENGNHYGWNSGFVAPGQNKKR